MHVGDKVSEPSSELLTILLEEMKQRLGTISTLASMEQSHVSINLEAQQLLQTVDAVTLYQRLVSDQTKLQFEPLHVGSVVYDVAHVMDAAAKQKDCSAQLSMPQHLQLVSTDRLVFYSALLSLWQAFIGIVPPKSEFMCQAKKTASGVRISMHADFKNVPKLHLSKSNLKSAQPFTAIAGPASSLLAAQGLFGLLQTDLGQSRRANNFGLGATLKPSAQLQFFG